MSVEIGNQPLGPTLDANFQAFQRGGDTIDTGSSGLPILLHYLNQNQKMAWPMKISNSNGHAS
jgi:hypothetical protein